MQSLAAERYFVSKEQEDAAKWQMFENYKELNGKIGALAGKIQAWGAAMNQAGNLLQQNPYVLQTYAGRTIAANLPSLDNLPEKSDLTKASQELVSLQSQLATLSSSLRQAGLDVSKL